MPAKSKEQYRFMKMLEHNPDLASKHNMTSKMAKEYTQKNTGEKRFSKLREKIKK